MFTLEAFSPSVRKKGEWARVWNSGRTQRVSESLKIWPCALRPVGNSIIRSDTHKTEECSRTNLRGMFESAAKKADLEQEAFITVRNTNTLDWHGNYEVWFSRSKYQQQQKNMFIHLTMYFCMYPSWICLLFHSIFHSFIRYSVFSNHFGLW